MKCFMLWYGGDNFAAPDQFVRSHITACASIADAVRTFDCLADEPLASRAMREYGGPEAWITFHDPHEDPDLYPDRILSFGPREGIRIERS